jgi:quercetin dioxygenase-like cupin family protein
MPNYIIDREECSHHQIFPGVTIDTVAGEGMMLSHVNFEPLGIVKPHSHPHEQMGLLLEGELEFTIGDETTLVRPGQMWRIPGGVLHGCQAGEQGAKALDVFHPIRKDYL